MNVDIVKAGLTTMTGLYLIMLTVLKHAGLSMRRPWSKY